MARISNEESEFMKTLVAVDKGRWGLPLKHQPDGAFRVSVGASVCNTGTAASTGTAAN